MRRRAGVLAVGSPLILLLLIAIGCAGAGVAAKPETLPPAPERYPIVPEPRHLEPRPGEFRIDRETRILLSRPASTELHALSELLAAPLRAASGLPLPVSPESRGDHSANAILIQLTPGSAPGEP